MKKQKIITRRTKRTDGRTDGRMDVKSKRNTSYLSVPALEQTLNRAKTHETDTNRHKHTHTHEPNPILILTVLLLESDKTDYLTR